MQFKSIAAVTASVAASVMLLTVAYGVSDAIINSPEAIETSAAQSLKVSNHEL
jgi:hypothetical protein